MFRLFKEFYLIRNFPKNYPLYKKVFANIAFFFSRLIIHRRENKLSFKDLFKANLKLRRGDIVICGEQETIFSKIIGDAVNHAVIYVGKRRFVEATGKGVSYISFHKLFTYYNSFIILRTIKGTRHKVIRKAINWAKNQVGKPYNYEWKNKNKAYFCSELTNEAYLEAGYITKLRSFSPPRSLKLKIQTKITNAAAALRPARMVKGNFRIILVSHNLEIKGKKISLKKILDNK